MRSRVTGIRAGLASRYAVVAGHVRTGDRVLDVGCGDACALGFVRDRATLSAGIDADAVGVALARDMLGAARHRPAAPFIVRGLAEDLPFADNCFDIALFVDVIEHIPDPAPCVDRIARVLARDGRLVVTTPQRIPGRWWDRDHHVREYTVDELRAALLPHFNDVKVRLFLSRRWWWVRRRVGKGFMRFWARHVRNPFLDEGTDASRFHHLIAVCTRPRIPLH